MATQNRYYSNTATVTTLTNAGGINSGALTLQVGATTGWPVQFPFIARIEPATVSEEVVLVTGGAGTSGNPYTIQRGYDGTFARAHSQGVVVKHGFAQIDFQEPQVHINAIGPGGVPNPHSLPDTAWSSPTFVNLFSSTLGSNAASFVISSIPSTYKNLRLYITAIGVTASTTLDMQIQFNSDTAAHYGWSQQYAGNTASTGSAIHTSNSTQIKCGSVWGNSSSTVPGVAVIDIPWYSGTSLQKCITAISAAQDGGATTWLTEYITGIWMSTAAINTITLTLASSTSFATGSSVALYGMA